MGKNHNPTYTVSPFGTVLPILLLLYGKQIY